MMALVHVLIVSALGIQISSGQTTTTTTTTTTVRGLADLIQQLMAIENSELNIISDFKVIFI